MNQGDDQGLPSTPAYAGLTALPVTDIEQAPLYPRVRGADDGDKISAPSSSPTCSLYPHIRGADLLTCNVSRFGVAVGSLPRWWLPGEP